jgi:hypothetical protein
MITLFVPLLTTLFIGLKLTGYIAWAWLWVLSPLSIGLGIVVGTVVFVAARGHKD